MVSILPATWTWREKGEIKVLLSKEREMGSGQSRTTILPEHRFFFFLSSENTLNDTVMIDVCHYMFVQTQRMYSSTKNPSVNYGLR